MLVGVASIGPEAARFRYISACLQGLFKHLDMVMNRAVSELMQTTLLTSARKRPGSGTYRRAFNVPMIAYVLSYILLIITLNAFEQPITVYGKNRWK